MVIYTPADEASKAALARLVAGEEADARFPRWPIHAPEREVATVAGTAREAVAIVAE